MISRRSIELAAVTLGLAACMESARLPHAAGTGPVPTLPPPQRTMIPTVNVAPARGGYFGQHVDERVKPPRPDLVSKAIKPDYALGSHVAALGLTASDGAALPPPFASGMFIGEHGSWNRKPRSGYKVTFVRFGGGRPMGPPLDVLTGFVSEAGEAYGRPVGVVIDKRGALLVADDVGNVIWRVTATDPTAPGC